MKIARYKKVHRYMNFFRNSYGFRLPYQILIDGTFCVAAKKGKVNIAEQLPKYFGGPVKILTTQCVILETENFGKQLFSALVIVKQFKHHRCGHEGKPIPAFECLMSMLGAKNENRYIIATQDFILQKAASHIPGVPVLYLHEQTPTLKPPSETSTRMANLSGRERFCSNMSVQRERITGLQEKRRFGIEEEVQPERKHTETVQRAQLFPAKKKRRRQQAAQTPNPYLRQHAESMLSPRLNPKRQAQANQNKHSISRNSFKRTVE
ncbi:rRNA-processing protein UTP23-like protein [Gryllus bimaculatus]|nr:rRNA-processing protein UTP23-like protein [Gryllus bimaculatus]